MKKMLTVVVLLLLVSLSNAAVDIRLKKISESIAAGEVTLVVAVESRSFSWSKIAHYMCQFYVGSNLAGILTDVQKTDQLYFTDGLYNKNITNTSGYCHFKYTAKDSTATKTFDGNGSWYEILRYTFKYPYTPGSHTTFEWSSNSEYDPWLVERWSATFEEYFMLQNQQMTMPADLVDMSLPVQMGKTIAEYSYEKGVNLEWVTQSEQNCAGFHVLRSTSPDGGYEKVTAEMIPGQINSSSLQAYRFTDPNVTWDKTYYYKIQEISTQFMDTSKTFYGPLAVTTGKTPDKFGLSQNYPNPFNPTTEIEYKITEASKITIKIYNLLGKEIKTLVNDNLPAGIYKVQWNGADDFGHDAPSGLYLYRITAGDKSEMHRMTKMK